MSKSSYFNKIKEFVKPYYYAFKDFFDFQGNKLLKKNKSIKNLYYGKRCFLICTGASLEQIDITKLKDEYTLGVGWIILHKEIKNLNLKMFLRSAPIKVINTRASYPSYYYNAIYPEYKDKIYEEKYYKFCKRNIDRGYLFYRTLDNVLMKGSKVFVRSDDYKFINWKSLFENKKVYYLEILNTFHTHEKDMLNINIDLTKRFVGGTSAIFNSIIAMIYMGFKEIYLCGAGYTYHPIYELHFYDNYVFSKEVGYKKASELAKSAVDIHNKKHDSNIEYFGLLEKEDSYKGIYVDKKTNDPTLKKEHRMMYEYAKSQNVKMYNVVPEGFESPIYEKISWEEVVGKVLSNKQK